MRLGVVLVHFHTPELAASAVKALRQEAVEANLTLDLLLVDNGSTPEGRRQLKALEGVRLLEPGANLGYAGAFNFGAAELSETEALAVINPDVQVLPGCLAALTRALGSGAGVVGPRFWWDRPGGFLLPPTEERGRGHSMGRFLAARRDPMSARRRWRRHARRHWLATETISSHALSGAFLLIEREAWRRVGPFDDGYPLYFEETDWLERARRAGVGGAYVPAAQALHAYAQSTPKEPRSAAWFMESHQRFRRRHYGRLFTGGLVATSRLWPERRTEVPVGQPKPEELEAADWLEVAASPLGFPAAACRVDSAQPTWPEGPFWIRGLKGEEELWAYGSIGSGAS